MRLLCAVVLVAWILPACSPADGHSPENLPPGDANRGAELFIQSINGAPPCAACHTLDGTALSGPGLQGYAATSQDRVGGITSEAYTLTSIISPGTYVVRGFGNVMYDQYAQRLTPQQLADLIAYLLTL